MLVWSTVSPFVIKEILLQWILTIQDEQKPIGLFWFCLLCVCAWVCVCVCLVEIVSVLIILDVSWGWSDITFYYIFLCTIFSTDDITQVSYTEMGNFY